MNNTVVIRGFGGPFVLTYGYGDSTFEPAPIAPSDLDSFGILGESFGGMTVSITHVDEGGEEV